MRWVLGGGPGHQEAGLDTLGEAEGAGRGDAAGPPRRPRATRRALNHIATKLTLNEA